MLAVDVDRPSLNIRIVITPPWPGIPVLPVYGSMNISWHLLLFLCHADTNPFKCKSPQDFSHKVSSHKWLWQWRVKHFGRCRPVQWLKSLLVLLMCECFLLLCRVIPPCDPTADDRLYHICIAAISVSPQCCWGDTVLHCHVILWLSNVLRCRRQTGARIMIRNEINILRMRQSSSTTLITQF